MAPSTVIDRPVASPLVAAQFRTDQAVNACRHKVAFVTDSIEIDNELSNTVQHLQRDGAHIAFVIAKRGPLSKWLSQNHVHYFVFDTELPELYHTPWLRAKVISQKTSELSRLFADFRIDHVIAVTRTTLGAVASVAARLSSVPHFSYYGQSEISASSHHHARRKASPLWTPLLSTVNALNMCRAGLLRLAYCPVKRCADIIGALILAVVLAPLWLSIVCSRVLRGQSTVDTIAIIGLKNQPAAIYSFGLPNSEHGTRWWWLASLGNVLAGQLSLVGPRILSTSQMEPAKQAGLYFHLAPGLTGWAQLKGTSFSDSERQAMDQAYMLSVNPFLDLKIVAATLVQSILRR